MRRSRATDEDREKARAYYAATRTRKLELQKSYREANKGSIAARKKAWREETLEAREAYGKAYLAANKHIIADKRKFSNLSPERMELIKKRANEYRIAHPEIRAAQERNRRSRIRGADGTHSAEEILSLLKGQRQKCAGCKVSIKSGYHADHIIALINGGSNWIRNIQLLCQPCNQNKHAKDPIVWAQECGRLL